MYQKDSDIRVMVTRFLTHYFISRWLQKVSKNAYMHVAFEVVAEQSHPFTKATFLLINSSITL